MRVKRFAALITFLLATSCGADGSDDTPVKPMFSVGGTVTGLIGSSMVLHAGSDAVSVPARASSFVFATALPAGASYSVTIATQPSAPAQTCTVQNGAGTIASANVTNVAIVCSTTPQTAIYVVNSSVIGRSSSQISSYQMDPATGTIMRVVGANTYAPACTRTIALVQPTRLLLASFGSPAIDLYLCGTRIASADLTSGNIAALKEVDGPLEDQSPIGIYPHPGGQLAYYLRGEHAYDEADDPADVAPGQLRPYNTTVAGGQAVGTPASAGVTPRSAVVDPAGRFVIVADEGAGLGSETVLRTLTTTTPTAPVAASLYTMPTPPWALAYAAAGPYVYASSPSASSGYAFTVDAAGKLTPIGGGTFASMPGVKLYATTGRFLFAAAPDSGMVQAFQIGGTGIPVKVGVALASGGTTPVQMMVDPSGRYLIVLNKGTNEFRNADGNLDSPGQSTLAVFAIGNDGALSAVGTPVIASNNALSFAVTTFVPTF